MGVVSHQTNQLSNNRLVSIDWFSVHFYVEEMHANHACEVAKIEAVADTLAAFRLRSLSFRGRFTLSRRDNADVGITTIPQFHQPVCLIRATDRPLQPPDEAAMPKG
jgi:hypothetical protein